jgi:hypothetical protein
MTVDVLIAQKDPAVLRARSWDDKTDEKRNQHYPKNISQTHFSVSFECL